MKTDELIKALGQLKVQTGSLVCLGCRQHEDNCGVHGCALIREAVTQLIEQNGWINARERLPERGVPVVYCRDCKHFNHEHMECENEAVSTDYEGGAQYSLNFGLDDFCSYGESAEVQNNAESV